MARYSVVALAFAMLASIATASDGCQVLNGNYYCKEVDQITYENIGADSMSYQDVVRMSSDGCVCQKQPKSYSGKMAPLDEQVCSHQMEYLHKSELGESLLTPYQHSYLSILEGPWL